MDALSFTNENTAFVYRLDADGSTMIETPVTVGVSNGNYVEIKEGLSEGDEVFAVAKTETVSAMTSIFSSMFGGQQINNRDRNTQRNNNWNNTNRSNGYGNGTGGRGGN